MIEDAVRNALVAELERQAANTGGKLSISSSEGRLAVKGSVNLDELVMAILGAVAGGP